MNSDIQLRNSTETETETEAKAPLLSLLRNQRGDFIQKLIIIGLFAFAVAVGIRFIAGKAGQKLQNQGNTIEKDVTDSI